MVSSGICCSFKGAKNVTLEVENKGLSELKCNEQGRYTSFIAIQPGGGADH